MVKKWLRVRAHEASATIPSGCFAQATLGSNHPVVLYEYDDEGPDEPYTYISVTGPELTFMSCVFKFGAKNYAYVVDSAGSLWAQEVQL